MAANVEIVRKEMIKPSSPTPHHFKEHKLSLLDQMAPPVYIPLIFFYEEANQKYSCQLLKNSLSLALTYYYPLAGRKLLTDDNYCIDCNDAGALFVEAKVQLDSDFLKFIENPDMDDMKLLLPLDHINGDDEVILAVQMNLFGCGGIAIAVQMSHKIGDGNSLVNFMNAWGAIYRGGDIDLIMHPRFDAASLFPPRDLSILRFKPTTIGITKQKIVTKRLVFDKEKLDILKHVYASSANGSSSTPTRVEIVSALIWKHLMDVTKRKFVALHAVNLRPRMNPTLPDHAFGNICTYTVAQPMKEEGENGYHGKLRVSIKSINEDYVKKIQNGDEYLHNLDSFAESVSKREIELCNFSSWCRFPVYEVDYGWGKPVWVSTTTLPFKNVAILLSTKNGDGIEVWINMLEEEAFILDIGNVAK